MSKNPRHQRQNDRGPEAARGRPELETVILKPPDEIDRTPPPMANDVRVLGGADAMTIHLYYVSPTRLTGAFEGKPLAPGVTIHQNMLIVESEPVARVALPVTVAARLAALIVKTIAEGAPSMLAKLADVGNMITEATKTANEAGAVSTGPGPEEEA